MPGKPTSFWSRLTGVFRKPSPNGSTEPGDLPAIGEDGLLLDPPAYPDPAGEADAAAGEKSANPLVRWSSRRDQTLTKLQEGYERLNQVIEDIQQHLAQQGERTDRIVTALETLARSLGDMPNISRQQIASLEAIAGNIEAGNARLHQVSEAVGELPKVSRAQTEALHGIKKQLEVTGEQNFVTAQTMEKLSTAITTLGEANATQLEALRQMNSKADDQTDQLGKLIARQGRRFIALFIVTVVLAAAAITTAIISLALRHG